jgi:hypothetical protein
LEEQSHYCRRLIKPISKQAQPAARCALSLKPAAGAWIIHLHASTRQSGASGDGHLVLRIADPDRRGEPLDPARPSQRLSLSPRKAQAIAALVKNGGAPHQQGDPAHPRHPRLRPSRCPQPRRAARAAGQAGLDVTSGGEKM